MFSYWLRFFGVSFHLDKLQGRTIPNLGTHWPSLEQGIVAPFISFCPDSSSPTITIQFYSHNIHNYLFHLNDLYIFEFAWLLHTQISDFTSNFWTANTNNFPDSLLKLAKKLQQWKLDVSGSIKLRKRRCLAHFVFNCHSLMLLPFSCRIWLFYNKRNFTGLKDPKRNVFWMVTITHASSISHQPFGLTRTISVNFEILLDPRFQILIWLSYLFSIFSLVYSLVIIIYFLFLLWSVFPLYPPMATSSLNGSLQSTEIKTAIFQMGPHKTPEVDGFLAFFYQKFWDMISPFLVPYIVSIFNSGYFLHEINSI